MEPAGWKTIDAVATGGRLRGGALRLCVSVRLAVVRMQAHVCAYASELTGTPAGLEVEHRAGDNTDVVPDDLRNLIRVFGVEAAVVPVRADAPGQAASRGDIYSSACAHDADDVR